jgi:hypothetical protein
MCYIYKYSITENYTVGYRSFKVQNHRFPGSLTVSPMDEGMVSPNSFRFDSTHLCATLNEHTQSNSEFRCTSSPDLYCIGTRAVVNC